MMKENLFEMFSTLNRIEVVFNGSNLTVFKTNNGKVFLVQQLLTLKIQFIIVLFQINLLTKELVVKRSVEKAVAVKVAKI